MRARALSLLASAALACDGGGTAKVQHGPDAGPDSVAPGVDTAGADATSGVDTPGPVSCVATVAAGLDHTCATRSDGSLLCWGRNVEAQLGDGTMQGRTCGTYVCRPSAEPVTALGSDVAEVVLGFAHTCARKRDGTVWCWGVNEKGETGNGAPSKVEPVPKEVTGLGADVVELAAGAAHTCARKSDGAVFCWGANTIGQLGRGAPSMFEASALQVSRLGDGVVEIAAGIYHTCARKNDDTIWCWGANGEGQLGDGTGQGQRCGATMCRAAPVEVKRTWAEGVVQIASGSDHTCARTVGGVLWCWGLDERWQLGAAAGTPRALCGRAVCRNAPAQVAGLGGAAKKVGAGGWHTCAVRTDGVLLCWGKNNFGEVGDGTQGDATPRPSQVKALGDTVVDVSAGFAHTCAIRNDRTLWCWGMNGSGQTGDGTTGGARPTPQPASLPCPGA